MSIHLKVNFSQIDAAKAAGAKWDTKRREWFYPGDELPESLKPFSGTGSRDASLRCRCGNTGRAGAYPFSTAPHTGRCDDCF